MTFYNYLETWSKAAKYCYRKEITRLSHWAKVTLSCTMKEKTHSLIVDVAFVPIFGLEASTMFGLEKKVDSLTETVYSKEMVSRKDKDVFEGLACMTQEYHIEI